MPQDLEQWRTKVRDAGLGFEDDPITLSLTLALPALFPLRDRRSTEALLTALPGFRARLYDVQRTADFLSPVESGDELVREALNYCGETERCADVLVGALRAVAAADRPPGVESLCRLASVPGVAAQAADLALTQALSDDPDGYLPALVQAAPSVEDPTRIIELLHRTFAAASYEVAVDAYLSLPRHNSRLGTATAQIALDLFSRNAFGSDPEDEPSPMLDLHLATRRLDGQRPEEAAAFARRAAGNAHSQDLRVRALVTLSQAMAQLGHPWYAREKAEEALAVARGVGNRGLLFDTLQTVITSNHAVHDHTRAAAASLEALELSRKLDPEDRAVALSLACAAHTGEPARAAEFAAESVALLRDLADRDPARHLPRYIAALDIYAIALDEAGQDGFDVGRQALTLIQDLHRRDPGQHSPQYAQVALNFSNRLAARGDHATALEGYLTATRVLHELLTHSPRVYAAKCAIATWSMANALATLQRWSEAEQAIRGAIKLQRSCVGESQPWVIPDLLDSLEFLKFCLSRAEQVAEIPALEAEQQALRLVHARYQKLSGSAAPPDG